MTTNEHMVLAYAKLCRENKWKYFSPQAEAIRDFCIEMYGGGIAFDHNKFLMNCLDSHIGEP